MARDGPARRGGRASALRRFVEEYLDQFWERPFPPEPLEDAWLREGRVLVAERDGELLGMAKGVLAHGTGRVSFVYVRPDARREGLGTALLRDLADWFGEQGVEHVTLGVDTSNAVARAVWQRLGFAEYRRELSTPLGSLLGRVEGMPAGSFGSIHVQTDDVSAVARSVGKFVPRLAGRSLGSAVAPPRNGWVAVYDEVCDRDPRQLRRLARELSDGLGAVVLTIGVEEGAVVRFVLHDRGRVVDEYLSVQEYYGPLPPGDVIALAANPTVVSRLTGADPAAVRAAALHGASPAELPPPAELLGGLARALGIEGAEHGYAEAREQPDVIVLDR